MTHAVDVAVVGGGVVGCATAAFLAGSGGRVLLVEATAIAGAASGRNSGVVQRPFDPVLASLYHDTVVELRALEAAAPDRFSLPTEPAGLLYLSNGGAGASVLARQLRSTAPELEPTFLDSGELRRVEPGLAPGLTACRLAIGFPVGPGRVTRAFEALARERGVRVEIGAHAVVERAASDGGGGERVVGVRVGGRLVPARSVVVAAGPWTPSIVDPSGAWRPIRALWGAVAQLELADPPRHVLEEIEIDATIEPAADRDDDAKGADVPVAFSLVTADGRSVLGSTFTATEPDDARLVAELVTHGSRFLPALAEARVIGSRRCARPLSVDGRPLVGAIPGVDGLFVAAGHGPWGISTGAGSARLVADLIAGGGEGPGVPAELDPARFGYLSVPLSR